MSSRRKADIHSEGVTPASPGVPCSDATRMPFHCNHLPICFEWVIVRVRCPSLLFLCFLHDIVRSTAHLQALLAPIKTSRPRLLSVCVFNTRKYPSLRVPSRFAPAKINGLSDVVDHPGIQNLNCGDNSLLLSSRNRERRNKGYNLPSATLTTQGVTARGVSPAKLCPATRCRPPTHLRAYRHCHR